MVINKGGLTEFRNQTITEDIEFSNGTLKLFNCKVLGQIICKESMLTIENSKVKTYKPFAIEAENCSISLFDVAFMHNNHFIPLRLEDCQILLIDKCKYSTSETIMKNCNVIARPTRSANLKDLSAPFEIVRKLFPDYSVVPPIGIPIVHKQGTAVITPEQLVSALPINHAKNLPDVTVVSTKHKITIIPTEAWNFTHMAHIVPSIGDTALIGGMVAGILYRINDATINFFGFVDNEFAVLEYQKNSTKKLYNIERNDNI